MGVGASELWVSCFSLLKNRQLGGPALSPSALPVEFSLALGACPQVCRHIHSPYDLLPYTEHLLKAAQVDT